MGLNDLVIELANILDSKAINRIEKEIFLENKKFEWNINS